MRLLALLTLIITLSLSGCAVVKDSEKSAVANESQAAPLELIARDFVSVISQLESALPAGMTIDLQRIDSQDAFTLAMLNALQNKGYGVRWVDDEGSTTLFQYRRAAENAAARAHRATYELAVGFVEMRREYAYDDGHRVRPVTPLYVRGADASAVVLDDTIFDQTDDEKAGKSQQTPQVPVTVGQVAKVNAVPLTPLEKQKETAPSTIGLQNSTTLKVPSDANPLNRTVGDAVSGKPLSLPLVTMPHEVNVFDLGKSNYSDLLTGRELVAEQVLIFENDSMRLGARNKKLVEQMVERFDPGLDVFSVIGCSLGPTQVKGGNAALALGRAGRVVEALRFAGVDNTRILDEGCWAGDGDLDDLPRRGVVLTLNRQV